MTNNLKKVIEQSWCIACGACLFADPSLDLVLNPKKLMYEPSGAGNKDAASVCPAVKVDFSFLQQKRFPEKMPVEIGVVENIFLAQSKDYKRNESASSGGVIKELLISYIQRPDVDGIIALTHIEGLLFEPEMITSKSRIDDLPGSIYHNVPFDNALRILIENPGKKFVLVANPCQMEGIFNYIYSLQPDLLDRIYITIGLICGWTYNHHAIKAISLYKNLDFSKIENISYRGGGPVGNLKLTSADKKCEVNRRSDFSYIVAFDRSFNLPRCHLCINHVNYLADVVVGDAWLSDVKYTKTGVSIVICRTKKSVEDIRNLEQSGYITVAEAGIADIVESQGRNLVFGDSAYSQMKFLENNGIPFPLMEGPNRPFANLDPLPAAQKSYIENQRKFSLQQNQRYRLIYLRKIALDMPRYAWIFFNRIIRKLTKSSIKNTGIDQVSLKRDHFV